MSGPNIEMETIVDGLDLFDDDEAEYGNRIGVEDPISALVGAHAYVESYVDDACYEAFGDGTWTEPKTFDRYYYEQKVLIDIVEGTDPDHDALIEAEKSVAFKREWAAENDRRYLVLNAREFDESDPGTYFDQHLAPLGVVRPPHQADAAPAGPVPMILGPEPPASSAQTDTRHSGAAAPAGDEQPAAELPDETVAELDEQAAVRSQNPLEGVDLAAEGFEETVEPLVLEDESGVTRPPEPEAPAEASVEEPKAAAQKPKPKRQRSSVQRPKREG